MKQTRLFCTTLTAVMVALSAVIYMIFPEIPLVPGVEYLKIDLSDIPALVTGMTVGPFWGILVELIKNAIHLFRTTTFGIGEAVNCGIGAAMILSLWGGCRLIGNRQKRPSPVVTASVYYLAAVGCLAVTIVVGWALNAALTPLFYRIMHWPLTAATLAAGVWGSTLLNAVKTAVTVLPFFPLVRILQKYVDKQR